MVWGPAWHRPGAPSSCFDAEEFNGRRCTPVHADPSVTTFFGFLFWGYLPIISAVCGKWCCLSLPLFFGLSWYSIGVIKTFDDSLIVRTTRKPEAPIDAVTFARTRLGFEPDAQQIEVLESTAKRGILNCSRQWGKSTVCAAKAVHRAFTRPGSVVLVASPSERQSGEFLRKAGVLVRRLNIRPRGDGDNTTSLLFPNGSRIVGLPGTEATVRGFSAVSLILIDEASRVDDSMYEALRPMLAVGGGDLWLMSTPNGQRGFFYQAWRDEAEEWVRIRVRATDCARIPEAFLKGEEARMPADLFAQEYLCGFNGNDRGMFDRALVEAAVDENYDELKIDPPQAA